MKPRFLLLAIVGVTIAVLWMARRPVAPKENAVALTDDKAEMVAKDSRPSNQWQRLEATESPPAPNQDAPEASQPTTQVAAASEAVLKLLKNPRTFPSWNLITNLTPADLPALVRAYKETTNLVDRMAVTWGLAYVGDETVVELFKHSLLHEFAGRRLTTGGGTYGAPDEEFVLFEAVRALGFLGSKYDSAYAFIEQGTDPWFWKANVRWSSDRGRDTVGILTARCITFLGLSDRPGTMEKIEAFKERDLINRTGDSDRGARNFNGSVVEAAFYQYEVARYGLDYLRRIFSVRDVWERLWMEWKQTAEGQQWGAWYKQTNQRPDVK